MVAIRTKEELQQLDEASLRREVLIPLLKAMGYEDVEEYHGAGELGMDIVAWKLRAGSTRENWAVVAKAVKMTGRAALGAGSVGEIQTQVLQCLGGQFPDPRTGEQRHVDKCLVVSGKPSKREFIAALSPVLKAAKVQSKVEFWNAGALWDKYRKYVLGIPHKIEELLTLSDSLDPDYRLEFGQLSPSKREIHLVPKADAWRDPKPLNIVFADTAEGEAARKAIDDLLRKGIPADLPAGAILTSPMPAFLSDQFDVTGPLAWHLESPPDPNLPNYTAQIDFQCEDGSCFMLDNVLFRAVGRGSEAVTLSNDIAEQAIPLEVRLTLMNEYANVHMNLRASFPQNAYLLREIAKLHNCLSQKFSVSITDARTGLPNMHMPNVEGKLPPLEPDYLDLIEDLATVQLKTGRPIVLPDRDWTADEESTVAQLRMIIRHGGYLSTWDEAEVGWKTDPQARAEALKALDSLKDGKMWLRMDEEQSAELFGVEIPLGQVSHRFHARIANESEVREMLTNPPAELQELTFKLVPGDGDVVAVHYMDWKPTLEVELPEWMNDGYM